MRQSSGFTLIELLIVVAIIAILAAIAVPNFLEAQVRAKVSRAQSDMRSLATALEAYSVDNNGYIQSICPDYTSEDPTDPYYLPGSQFAPNDVALTNIYPNGARDTWKWYSKLTTPVAYMSSIPLDPFAKPDGDSWTGSRATCPYHCYTGTGARYAQNHQYVNSRRNIWLLISLGPNLEMDTRIDHTDWDCYMFYNPLLNVGGGGWEALHYDATNGTTSMGDLYRTNAPADYLPIK